VDLRRLVQRAQLVDHVIGAVEGGDADAEPSGRPARPAGTAHSASIRVVSRGPATTSNQYQPPSMNGVSGSVRSIVTGSSVLTPIVSTGWLWPRAVERYRTSVDSPARRTRRVTESTVVQRRQ
jgi:hypothetical protein